MKENLILIDTDILIHILKKTEPAHSRALEYLKNQAAISISLITYYECLRGFKTLNATQKMKTFKQLLKIIDILPLNTEIFETASEIYANLSKQGKMAGEFDILIGATAITNNMILASNNTKHFSVIQKYHNLNLINWMK